MALPRFPSEPVAAAARPVAGAIRQLMVSAVEPTIAGSHLCIPPEVLETERTSLRQDWSQFVRAPAQTLASGPGVGNF
jgi:hypothetical protein